MRLTHRFINDVFRGPVYGSHDIFTARSWREFVHRNDLDLSRALFAHDDGKTVGAIAFAQRGERAWLSVMGVLPPYRKRGFGRQLFAGAVEAVRAGGAREIEFEVVQRNEHARRMYESYGFRIVGELYVWARKAKPSVAAPLYARRQTERTVRALARDPAACWQREAIAVARAGESTLIQASGAYAYVRVRDDNAILLDAGARNEASAAALLTELDSRVPHNITLLNEPKTSSLTTALEASDWRIVERQYRMTNLSS